ncbi:hypothetical protein HHI36_017362 [Cryptolaemus montrouzieri]|uniref:Uncharacterized protein n=1 Tax=Cryptolaemus montrouzieri TaxID=559131 RepID=A0ABD2NM99_9CUCU
MTEADLVLLIIIKENEFLSYCLEKKKLIGFVEFEEKDSADIARRYGPPYILALGSLNSDNNLNSLCLPWEGCGFGSLCGSTRPREPRVARLKRTSSFLNVNGRKIQFH